MTSAAMALDRVPLGRIRQRYGPFLFTAAVAVVVYLLIGPAQFVNALTIGAIYALVALGYTMVYGIIELINFAHGDVFMVGAFASMFILTSILGEGGSVPSEPLIIVGLLVVAFG